MPALLEMPEHRFTKIGVAALRNSPDGVTSRVCGFLARHLQVVCARVQFALEEEFVVKVDRIYRGREVVFIGQSGADVGDFARSTDDHVSRLFQGQAEVVLIAGRVYVSARRTAEGQWQSVSFGAARLGDGRGVYRVRPIGTFRRRNLPSHSRSPLGDFPE